MGVAILAVMAWLVYGLGFVGYDGVYALIWGRELEHGRLPDYDLAGSPTPHPLPNLVAALLAPLGDLALPGLAALSLLALAALGWAAFRLGSALFSAPVGVLFATILLTRDGLVDGTHQALAEIPFLALVLWSVTLEAEHRRRGAPVLWLLLLAGLIRPEAWLLSAAYVAYLRPGPRLVALAAAAPVLWGLSDLVITGDALHSLHHTQAGADRLERPRDVDVALQGSAAYLRDILHPVAAWGGLAGCVLGLWLLYERAVLAAAVLAAGMLAFLALGVAGVPLLPRYYYLPAAMLALFCAVAAFGWLNLPRDSPARRGWMVGAVVLAAALALSAPRDRERLAAVRSASLVRADLQGELRALVQRPATRSTVGRCPPLYVPDLRVAALAAYWLDVDPASVVVFGRPPGGGSFIGPGPGDARRYVIDPRLVTRPRAPLPAGYAPVARTRGWTLYRGC